MTLRLPALSVVLAVACLVPHSGPGGVLERFPPAPESAVVHVGVPLDQSVTVRFNKAVDPATVVRKGDDKWFDLVRWTMFGLVTAEELDVTQANLASHKDSTVPNIRSSLAAMVKP